MQDLARETSLQETTFVFRATVTQKLRKESKFGSSHPTEELPFAGHQTLGTATVLRMKSTGSKVNYTAPSTIVLDLQVGKVPVSFHANAEGVFGEMKQVDPIFGQVHNRGKVAQALGLNTAELEPDLPIQTVSTGLAFAIVPIRRLSTLQSLRRLSTA